jgi:hypothetical protein
MPKRWRIVRAGSYTWQLVYEPEEEDEERAVTVLAQSSERWETEAEVQTEIDRIKELDTPDVKKTT